MIFLFFLTYDSLALCKPSRYKSSKISDLYHRQSRAQNALDTVYTSPAAYEGTVKPCETWGWNEAEMRLNVTYHDEVVGETGRNNGIKWNGRITPTMWQVPTRIKKTSYTEPLTQHDITVANCLYSKRLLIPNLSRTEQMSDRRIKFLFALPQFGWRSELLSFRFSFLPFFFHWLESLSRGGFLCDQDETMWGSACQCQCQCWYSHILTLDKRAAKLWWLPSVNAFSLCYFLGYIISGSCFLLLWLTVITSHFFSKSFIMVNVTTTPAATASAAAAAELKAAKVAAKALRQVKNEDTAKYFAVGMTGIMGLFIIFRWTKFFYKRYGSKQESSSKVLRLPIALTR